jgi:hypothetical protein
MWGKVASTKKDLRVVSLSKKSFAVRYVKIPTPKAESPRDQPKGELVQSKELSKDQSKIVKHGWFFKAHLTVVVGHQKVFGA